MPLEFGAYVWKQEGQEWALQPNQPVDHAVASFGTAQAIVLLREGQLPTIRVNEVSFTPTEDRDELPPFHRDGWYNWRLPEDHYFHYAEGLVLPDTERLQFVGLKTPEGEWVAVAGMGVNEYPGDRLPTVDQCLEMARNVWQFHKEENGLL